MHRSTFFFSDMKGLLVIAAPTLERRQSACFLVGKNTLPQEVTDGIPALISALNISWLKLRLTHTTESVTCGAKVISNTGGVPDVTSGGISYSSIDFQSSTKSPVGFALYVY